ncbi:hypothetical protein [Lacinutrix jangbogonensis]|uniref:hypothetical protein n=1 Tax=Lacinutrix jangbogonensis TaxID=1469557 RepID=UPI00053E3E6E|nr:hypothetical protein [Lacinutrix jangbogonensis]
MKVTNNHKRKLLQPKAQVVKLFKTLATKEYKIWPIENWPAIRFNEKLKIGAKGGHGSVRYTIIDFKDNEEIKFQFSKPHGFIGTHEFCINAIDNNTAEITHEINMNTSTVKATFLWLVVIRWLHDALIEDAFDKVENSYSEEKKKTKYSLWVQLLRSAYKRKPFQIKHT